MSGGMNNEERLTPKKRDTQKSCNYLECDQRSLSASQYAFQLWPFVLCTEWDDTA
jgi:hypothetical protein